jgi:hypothetical protein
MTDPTAAFAKMVPGFDFLQGLVKNAGAAIPGVGHWVAPTMDPEELDKRIQELRTVQYWLEQNARMTASTIQALEVQKMTLSTLKTMNVSLGDLTEALKIRMPEAAPHDEADEDDDDTDRGAAQARPRAPFAQGFGIPDDEDDDDLDDIDDEDDEEEDEHEPPPRHRARAARSARERKPKAQAAPQVPPGVVDPMQWWGALTEQFTQIATKTMKESAAEAARHMAGAMVKQGMDAAGDTLMKAAAMPAHMAQNVANNMASAAGKAAGTAAGMVKAASGGAAPSPGRSAGKPARKTARKAVPKTRSKTASKSGSSAARKSTPTRRSRS